MAPFLVEAASAAQLAEYASVPSTFRASTTLRVTQVDGGLGGFRLEEAAVEPFEKNYDAYEAPADWPKTFDVSRWAFFLARAEDTPVGAAAVAYDTPDLLLLEGRTDLASLWDIRVRPDWQARGVGSALFREAVRWSTAKGCRRLKAETQNNNVGACKFYRRQGCR
ncbi:MAG: GNAT family N-acetyltransferase, partial [Planctomycetes bacterium]|nr:GNAT family N-acetyltransferase [Planctomycetota bacterium]